LRAAVVLDKSGTILRPCRVILDLQRNEVFFHINTLKFVIEIGGYLVNIKGTRSALKRGVMKVGKVICASSKAPPNISNAALRRVDILDALNTVMVEAERHCGSEVGTCAALVLDKYGHPTHAVGLGGKLYDDVKDTVEKIIKLDNDVFIATGNCREATLRCARILGIDKRFVLADASPKEKMNFVRMLEKFYGLVVMVGNDVNDLLAMREADLSILVKREAPEVIPPLEADYIVDSLGELPDIISKIVRPDSTSFQLGPHQKGS